VTAEAGRLGTPALMAIADSSGGIVVRIPDGVTAPARGTSVRISGPLADPYGQLEIRPRTTGLAIAGHTELPDPPSVSAADLGEPTEGRLVVIVGTASSTARKSTSGDLALDLVDGSGAAFRVMVDGSSGITAADLPTARPLRLTGIVGQRATRKGRLDGYRVWLRDRDDISPAGPEDVVAVTPVSAISRLLRLPDGTSVVVQATVTGGAALLDSSGRRIVVQDSSAAIEVLLPAGTAAPPVGSRLRIAGRTAHAWGAPQLSATAVDGIGGGQPIRASVRSALGPADEWRLVWVSGTVASVERLGDRWRAEVAVGSARLLVLGQAGAGIPSTLIDVGSQVTITGIVKRPYPTATDRRFGLLPRSTADVTVALSASRAPGSGLTASAVAQAPQVTPDTDLATLSEHLGEVVRVGGIVRTLLADGFSLDDGTARSPVLLAGDMVGLRGVLEPGEAVAAVGRVSSVDGALAVTVDDEGSLVRIGELGEALPIRTKAPASATAPVGDRISPAIVRAGGLDTMPLSSSILLVAGLTALSLLVTVLRRRQVRLRLRAVAVERLRALRDRTE
jgi:hypothetical protein